MLHLPADLGLLESFQSKCEQDGGNTNYWPLKTEFLSYSAQYLYFSLFSANHVHPILYIMLHKLLILYNCIDDASVQ